MRLVKYIAIAIVNAFGTVIGIIWVAVPATQAQLAPNYQLEISGRQPEGETAQSLPELYKLRDRLQVELDNLAKTRSSNPFSVEVWMQEIQQRQSQKLTQQLQVVRDRIQLEEKAKNYWDESAKIADRAASIGRNPNRNSATWQESQQLWQSAINTLRQIPHGSFLTDGAIDKTIEYQGNLTMATYELQVARSVEKIKAEEEAIRERARLEQEKIERARREVERKEQEKQERARREQERQELARQELARKELEKQEAARKEQERLELERRELVKKEQERLELEKQELAKQEQERLEQERNQQATPQPTPQLTPQPTPQLTPEATSQPTPQLTPEATSQPTPQLTPQPTETATPSPETPAASPNAFFFAGDTNRDGKIDDRDAVGKEQWSLSKGALILFDDRNGDRPKIPTWKEAKISVPRRPAMLSQVHLKLSDNFNKDTQLFIMADPDARPHISVFQKTGGGWQAVDISGAKPLVFSTEIVLGLEAKQFADRNWNGLVNLTATAVNNGQQIATNSIQMGVTPWMMPANTAPVTEVQVSDRGAANSDFIAQLKRAVEPTGAQVRIIQGDRAWLQDIQKNGYVQFPEGSEIRNFKVALKNENERAIDKPARSTREKDLSVFKIGSPRDENPVTQWSNGYGNLQVTPPIPGYPRGRIYYGNSGNNSFNPEVIDFIQAQRIQGPPVDIDTSWLLTRQVDEIINFIPTQTQGRFIMAIASPEAGVRMLEELAGKGYGNVTINRGLSNETTVAAALQNQALIQHNLNLQQQKLNPILARLKTEFALADDQIIQVPVMFGYSGYAWWPNTINSVPVNGNLLVSNPRGPLIDGKDYTQERLRQLLSPFGVRVSFLDDRYYQELKGNVQSATNTVRKGEEKPFWESLPNN
ncbi:MAG: protein-arginine deiminase [Oscillatoriaceae cyanobacterium Prado104]|jgi:protein-arginine deiminase|nr:protein-arginine deiminase [Oscillatoriaceae cyanobacterium Prado104]